ncbi:diguanylate cyclase [Pseudothauera lacus]|uniref:Diguanylate cyclase n=1 Tax=Pseudothauera lacus TaxID=2136175 RepID=A0A2T4IC51_9RHOO|nr:diguanylate cyclase [Pseudothauera lacus]
MLAAVAPKTAGLAGLCTGFPLSLIDKSRTVPRLHLLGTLTVVALLTTMLGGFFAWQSAHERQASFDRIEETVLRQQDERLQAELDSALSHVEFTRSRAERLLRDSLVEQVDIAHAVAEGIYLKEHGRRPDAEIRQLIVEALRPARFFDGRGYYFIDGMDGRFILLPTAPQFEGQLLPDNQDDTGHYIMRGLIEAARQPRGEGFSRYRWYRPDDPARMADKLAYVRHFEPYDWLIGTGDYTYEWDSRQQQEALSRLRSLRFGRSGYIGVLDRDGRLLLSQDFPALEGLHLQQMPASAAQALHRLLLRAEAGGGALSYRWHNAHDGTMVNKRALVQRIEPWGWTLAATLHEGELSGALADERERARADNRSRSSQVLVAVGLALLVAVLASLAFSRWSGRLFRAYHEENLAQRQALQQQAEALHESEEKLSTILDSVEAHIYIKDTTYRYLYVNRPMCALFGSEAGNVVGHTDDEFFDRETALHLLANDRRVIEHGERIATEESVCGHGDALPRTYFSVKIPLRRSDGSIYALCGISTDISQRKALEDEIRQLAFYDSLTGLANRRLLIDRLQQHLAASVRHGQYGALLFVDLDNFKTLNDTLGHDAGDRLLVQVAARLRECVRDDDTVARFGGDEFVCMLGSLGFNETRAAANARTAGEKILAALRQPYVLRDKPYVSTPSIGITLFAGRDVQVDDLLKQADLAMYQAKAAGRNSLSFYDPLMQARLNARATLEADLREALAAQQFVLHYQLQFDAAGNALGAEALLRWQHPERGEILPGEFIATAEETGLIVPLGNWVLEAACAQLRRWQQAPAQAHWKLAVNVSARQFRQPEFVDQVLAALAHSGADAHGLKLELTESLLLEDIDSTIAHMRTLKWHGVGFALDDFGTGYSSLAYLKQLPLDELKIDRDFVRDLHSDPNDAAIARAIINLAANLGLQVIAEGVETAAQRDFLVREGCQSFQGYLFARPLPADRLAPLGTPTPT